MFIKKVLTAITLASLIATPVYAGKYNLAEYKTVAVSPVLAASNTRGAFEAGLAASAAGLTYGANESTTMKNASGAGFKASGFSFAGKAQGVDVALLILSTTLGMLPTAMKIDAAKAKEHASTVDQILPKVESRLAPDVVKAIRIATAAVQGDDFQTALKALAVAMVVSAESIKKGNERTHGYVASGLFAGLATTWAAAGQQNTAFAQMAGPLVALLEEDAVMGGADRQVAAQLKVVATELNGSSPNLNNVVNAIGALQAIKPDA